MRSTRTGHRWAAMIVAAILMTLAAAIAAPAQNVPFTTLHGFDLTDGANPYAALIQAADGSLYGTTAAGGGLGSCAPGGCGTAFRITTSGTLTTLHYFCSDSGCADGAGPEAALVQAIHGNFYGTTTAGGASGIGTVFKITPIGTLTTLHSFDGTDGSNPYGPLVQAKDGNFYGTTAFGGANDWGTVFKMSPNGILTPLYSFCSQSGCTDGGEPLAGVVQGNDGDFYGTTVVGGTGGSGTVFKITASGKLTTLNSFPGNGAYPYAALIQATDGKFYGTTWAGTIFRITPDGTLGTLHTFDGSDGANPYAPLIQATDGNLYGTTNEGGLGVGTVFRITLSGRLTTLYSFSDANGGASQPTAALVQDTNGNFYGTTYY